jgi:WD40-like Beta Propeller Repeat
MTRFWKPMAVALLAIIAVAGCNDYGNTFQSPGGAILTFLSPSQLPASTCTQTSSPSCSSFALTLNGAGFVPQTRVQWNGKTCPLSSTSGAASATCITNITLDTNNNVTALTATITAALYAKPGTANVNAINPNSNYGTGTNGLSNSLTFIIDNPSNPAPSVTSVAPACVVIGNALAINVAGANFMNVPASSDPTGTQFSTLIWTLGSSQLQLTPNTATPATITATQITATIPAGSINTAGNATISVYNPPSTPVPSVPGSTGSGGGTSTITPQTTITVEPATGSCPAAANGPAAAAKAAAVAQETPAVSLDGRYVAYTAIEGEHAQIFWRDTCEGAATGCQPHTSLLSVTSDGSPAAGDSHTPSMSSDGRYVAFSSDATNLVENAPTGRQVYLRDTCARADASCKASTILVSTDSGGALGGAESILPSISSSGRFVAFVAVTPSQAPNHPPAEAKSSASAPNSGLRQVFVRDTCLSFRPRQFLPGDRVLLLRDTADSGATCRPKTTRISLEPGDGTGTDASPAGPALSGQATHVALPGAKASTLFTRSIPVDDRVFLAITGDER